MSAHLPVHLACELVLENVACFAHTISQAATAFSEGISEAPGANRSAARPVCGAATLTTSIAVAVVLANSRRLYAERIKDAYHHPKTNSKHTLRSRPYSAVGGARTPARAATREHLGAGSAGDGTDQCAPVSQPTGRWNQEQIQVLVDYSRTLQPGQPACLRTAVESLGWSYSTAVAQRVKLKLFHVRQLLQHGRDPSAGRQDPGAVPPARTRRDWLAGAFMTLPGRMGTVSDVAAVIEADPGIAPLLDRRPDPIRKAVPLWRKTISHDLNTYPEFINTGEKRGRLAVYRYDEETAVADAFKEPPAKAQKQSVEGLPYTGKSSK